VPAAPARRPGGSTAPLAPIVELAVCLGLCLPDALCACGRTWSRCTAARGETTATRLHIIAQGWPTAGRPTLGIGRRISGGRVLWRPSTGTPPRPQPTRDRRLPYAAWHRDLFCRVLAIRTSMSPDPNGTVVFKRCGVQPLGRESRRDVPSCVVSESFFFTMSWCHPQRFRVWYVRAVPTPIAVGDRLSFHQTVPTDSKFSRSISAAIMTEAARRRHSAVSRPCSGTVLA
jgi:hypothetical protein